MPAVSPSTRSVLPGLQPAYQALSPEPVSAAPASAARLRFGSGAGAATIGAAALARLPLGHRMMASFFQFLEAQPLAELLVKDILGFNLPKMGVALGFRGWQDFWDVTKLELGNTAWTLGTTFAIPRFLTHPLAAKLSGFKSLEAIGQNFMDNKVLAKLAKNGIEDITARKLAHLGGAFGFLWPFALGFTAMPFLRNAWTLKQTGTADFQALIGLEKADPSKEKRSYKEEMAYQLGCAKAIMLSALGLSVASVVGLPLLARQFKGKAAKEVPQALRKAVDFVYDKARLKGWGNSQFGSAWGTFLFWQMPAYMGWIAAARSPHERRERLIQSGNAVLWFSAITPLVTKPLFALTAFKPLYKKLGFALKEQTETGLRGLGKIIPNYQEVLLKPATKEGTALLKQNPAAYVAQLEPKAKQAYEWFKQHPEGQSELLKAVNWQELRNLGVSVSLLASTPAILNVFLTKARYAKEHEAELKAAAEQTNAANTSVSSSPASPNPSSHNQPAQAALQPPIAAAPSSSTPSPATWPSSAPPELAPRPISPTAANLSGIPQLSPFQLTAAPVALATLPYTAINPSFAQPFNQATTYASPSLRRATPTLKIQEPKPTA